MRHLVKGFAGAALLLAALSAFGGADVRAASLDELYSFPRAKGNGWLPLGGMVADKNGALYGVTHDGGAGCTGGCGVVYQLTPAASGPWKEKVLHIFSTDTGINPADGLIIGPDGTLYGTTPRGGSLDGGTVFAVTPPPSGQTDWTFDTLHEFDFNSTKDKMPFGKLLLGKDGALYGINAAGTGEAVTVFRLKRAKSGWAYKAIYRAADTLNPQWGLVQDPKGRLYGVGQFGGANGRGAIFRLTPPRSGDGDWSFDVVHNFSDDPADAYQPYGTLALHDGALYGQAYSNAAVGAVVFRLTLPSSFEIIYRMNPPTQGDGPGDGLTVDEQGVIYGVNLNAGPAGYGTFFKLMPPKADGGKWSFRLLHGFTGKPDGGFPYCQPLLDVDGNVYVNTQTGGKYDHGAVFIYRP